ALQSPRAFEVGTEPVEGQHVENDVPEASMHEHVGDQLPHRKTVNDGFGYELKNPQPFFEVQLLGEQLQKEHGDVGDQKPLDSDGKRVGIGSDITKPLIASHSEYAP